MASATRGNNPPQRRRTLYVSDLDGTLLGADSRVSAESRRLLNAAIARGALFTVATARTPATVAGILEGVDMRLPAIVMTGAARWNPRTGLYSHVRHFPAAMAGRLMRLCRDLRFPTFVYTLRDNMIGIHRIGPMTAPERLFIEERLATPFKRVMFDHTESGDPWRQPEPDPASVVLFYSLQPSEAGAAFRREALRAVPGVNALHYSDRDLGVPGLATFEMFAPGATKGAAVAALAAELGVERTVVFGDNVNDLSMAGHGAPGRDTRFIAPANAIPDVLARADAVIGPNTADSVARYIHEAQS